MENKDVEAFDLELETRHIEGLWKLYATTPSKEPPAVLKPYLWKWSEIEQDLRRAGEMVDLGPKEERRVLRLLNPGMQNSRATTHTMQMSFQLVKPGEIARAHRHTIAAIRFVVKGKGAFTTVEGAKYEMAPGDLILTPSWSWHDHGSESSEPIIWIDGLDSPLVRYLGVGFFEHFSNERQSVTITGEALLSRSGYLRPPGSAPSESLPVSYPWKDTLAALQARKYDIGSPYDGVILEYTDPSNGGHTFPTLSCCIQLLRPGEKTKEHRHTSGVAYHVFRGHGTTSVGEQSLNWQEGDCFVIPPWYWHKHRNGSSEEDAILFSLNDSPILESLGMHKVETSQ
ncbi:MAG: cupin domain-containing protein [Candidatus Binatia bacterium]